MDHIKIGCQTQADVRIFDKIDEFFNRFHVSTRLHRCGVRKRHGYSVRSLIKSVFSLPFLGKNFFRGIVTNDDVPLGVQLYRFFDRLTGDQRKSVLIIELNIKYSQWG